MQQYPGMRTDERNCTSPCMLGYRFQYLRWYTGMHAAVQVLCGVARTWIDQYHMKPC